MLEGQPKRQPKRGEVWRVDFDPTRGAEIQKTRPAVVVSSDTAGRLPLRLVVPLTGWQESFDIAPWLVRIEPEDGTGLTKISAADTFQTRSVALERFVARLGILPPATVEAISQALSETVEYKPPDSENSRN